MIRSSTEVLPKYLFLIIFAYFLFGENGAAAFHRLATTEELQNVPPATISNRTGYHFQSPKNWINDPNGPMYYKGIYHLFYQFNPKEPVWGNIVWAHSYSTDMINWNPLEPAIHPTKPFDINGCWSGSATILPGNKPVIMYTGIDERNRQVQNVAFPKNLSDPYLREWVKPDYNPVIQPEGDVNASSFRDPTTAWYGPDSHWKTVVGSRRGGEGVAVLYKSRDFIKWVKAKRPLHSVMGTGMWECPDFFPVLPNPAGLDNSAVGNGLKHVFKVSLDVNRFEYYTIGTYDFIRDRYVPDGLSPDNSTGLRFDYGNFYASKTFFDEGKGRRILWGWSNESDSAQDDWGKGWAGIQTIPRAVWLDGDGRRVVQWPIEEVRGLRRGQVGMYGEIVGGRGGVIKVRGVGGAQADVEVSFDVSGGLDGAERFDVAWTDAGRLCGQKGADEKGGVGPFGLYVLATEDREERTAVFFRIFRDGQKHVILMCHDPSKSSKRSGLYKPTYGGFVDYDLSKSGGKLPLRTLIDNSVVESFGANGRTCITSRIYPDFAVGSNARLFAFNNGAQDVKIIQLHAWDMRKPLMNGI